MVRTLIAGNWKMNGLSSAIDEAKAIAAGLSVDPDAPECLICAPATLLSRVADACAGSPLQTGGQTCHSAQKGAHTGDISAEMLADAGARYVIVGHSERRADHAESNAIVAGQAMAAWRAGLTPIVCCGETHAQHVAHKTLEVVTAQLDASLPDACKTKPFVVAYEPVWAIGTGLVPSLKQITAVHAHMRARLEQRFGKSGTRTRLLYGGSMKPSNAVEILSVPHVNGGLIGGASLKADDFLAIYAAAS